jgi:transcriptional regulator GlxA family with amidase domain
LLYHATISIFMVNNVNPLQSLKLQRGKPLRIAVLAYAGSMGTQVFGISEVLRLGADIARTLHPGRGMPFDIHIVGLRGRSATIAGGISIATQRPQGYFNLLVVPGLEITRQVDWDQALAPLAQELAFVRKTFAAGTLVASVCVGSFLLAEAGLLDGRSATTAWLFAPALAQRYPAITLQAASVLLDDAGVITTGAVSSAFDLAIHVLKRTLGADVATATALVSLLPEPRQSQSPFVDTRLIAPRLPSFSQQVAQWLESRLTEAFNLSTLAQAFCVSNSTLLRRVKNETGQSALLLLQTARVEKAKQLLHSTLWSLARITEAVGYTDVSSFTRLFTRLVGESPAHYRRRRASTGF